MMITWTDSNTFQFSASPKMPRDLRKQTTGKIRTWWLGRNWFNPIKMRRPNTPDTKVSELDKVDIKTPNTNKSVWQIWSVMFILWAGFSASLPQEWDWSSEDWDGTKAKAREQTETLIDINEPRPQTDNDKTTDTDKVAFSKLQMGQSDPKEEPIEMTDSLIPLSLVMETPGDMRGNADMEELSEAEKCL